MAFAVILGLLLVVILMLPLFLFRGQQLQEAASVDSVETLAAIKESLLRRYIEEEKAHREKLISDGVWRQRKRFLTTRYIDASRRLDYLNHLKTL